MNSSKEGKEYEVVFEGLAIVRVIARNAKGAICRAFQDLAMGDFEIQDYHILPRGKDEKA